MHLTILQVIIPIIASMCCFLTKKHQTSWCIALISTIATFSISCILLAKIYTGQIITYHIGNWLPPYGIELRIDMLNALMLIVVNFTVLMSLLYGYYINEQEISSNKITGFYSLCLLCVSGLIGILVTNDIFNLYVFLEIVSISSYVLVSMSRDKNALIASFEYLISGTIGATFYLFGIGLLYAITGTLNISDMSKMLVSLYDHHIIVLGKVFIFIGLSIKMGLFPLSRWLVNAYSLSPSFISIFFSGTVTKVMIYIFIRMFYTISNQNFFSSSFNTMIMLLTVFGMIFNSMSAIRSQDIKRLLAYSSVTHINCIILLLSFNSQLALHIAILHIINHSISKISLFMFAGCIAYKFNTTNLYSLSNLKRSMPYTTILLTILSLSLTGIPFTNGFVSKWYIMQVMIEYRAWIVLIMFSLVSFLTVIYVWNMIEKIYFEQNIKLQSNIEKYGECDSLPLPMVICVSFMTILTVITGIYSNAILLVVQKLVL
ncbi:proton-conducting transporter transmembrane domain-containing protein [Wolbachia endosymbiont of Howardula sp.]|uniref:proton-conducting transporter transmembrane domain-containing protein n=1 Tax=Wolbachia endosymbiont of Howardula sp. TaxID=2916816 RepID=UPI00217E35A5|nr:proton-conducting transporter membrane subunit [Wolbachia endosymbiont of Howardula sp.]UWI83042.1 cation:proton antiporter [Wolbachia endosymbiont of Howardula sp.]